MTLEQELQLSYFRQIADIDAEHGIYLVQDIRNRKIYVKKLLTVYNADIYRFLLMHPIPNTPTLQLVIEDAGVLTVIEEYIPGDTVEELLAQHGIFSEDTVIALATQLCRILSVFHSCTPAIVNRDIKPSNIKITPDGVLKLIDMNAAKWSHSHTDRDTVLLGTQGYAAPEQYGFGPSSVLTDIYSVGVLMNVMLTGDLPNKAPAFGRISRIIEKCTELSPAARYQNTEELLNALLALNKADSRTESRCFRQYLPPGFRGRNPLVWLFSFIGYATLFSIGFGLEVENAGLTELIINRIAFTMMEICIVLFAGNYLNIQQFFVLTTHPNRLIRWLGVIIVAFALILLWVILTDFFVVLLVR